MKETYESEQAKERLLEILQPGDQVFCFLRHKPRSGVSKYIDLYKFTPGADGIIRPYWLTRHVADLTGYAFSKAHECLRVRGCGLDVGTQVVRSVSQMLWSDSELLRREWL